MRALRQAMSGVHTWSGLLLGWLLYLMFCCGTIAFFQEELTRWMQPEVAAPRDQPSAIAGAQRWLTRNAGDAITWYISPPGQRAAVTQVYWQPPADAPAGARTSAKLDGTGREITARDTAGGYFLYRLHYDLHYLPVIWARYLVGVAAMFLLVALVSGIIVHKKIFADLFMLRLGKGQRSWLDAHNLSSVLALPFHLMIAYTGLVSLASLYAPAPIAAAFASEGSYYAAAFPAGAPDAASGRRAPLAPLDAMARDAAHRLGTRDVGYVTVGNPGDSTATVAISGSPAAFDTRGETARYVGTTGAPLDLRRPGPAQRTESILVGLHAARYADVLLRWFYFASGLFGTAMVATGLVLWTAKRRTRLAEPTRPPFGFRLVERLNVGVILGFPVALAGYFLANRLMPATMPMRANREIDALFGTFALALAWAAVRQPTAASRDLAAIGALAFAAIPLATAVFVPAGRAAWLTDMAAPTIDGAMLAAAGVLALVLVKARSRC